MIVMKKISVIIVAYNSESVIFDCLTSIVEFNDIGEELEVIVVDNSPSDLLLSSLDHYSKNAFSFKYIHNPQNGGFGQGNNVGVKVSTGDTLFFLNPDTILVSPVFNKIESALLDGANVGGFRLVDPFMKDNDSIGLLPEWNWLSFPRVFLNFLVIKLGFFTKLVFPWGAALFVSRQDFISAGMFDENMFLCNEEPDIIHRLSPLKLKIIDEPIIHLEGHTTVLHDYRFKEYLKTTKIYFNKHNLNFSIFIRIFYVKNLAKVLVNKVSSRRFTSSREVSMIIKDFF